MNENDLWWQDPEDDMGELEGKAPGEEIMEETNQPASLTPEEERLAIERERLEIERERNTRERTGRTFAVLQVRREMNEAERTRNSQAMWAGALIIGTIVVLRFNNVPADQIIQQEADILVNNNSWGALLQYFVSLGVLPVGMVAAAAMRIRAAFMRQREYLAARGRLEDLEQAAGINGDDLGLGGNGDANTR